MLSEIITYHASDDESLSSTSPASDSDIDDAPPIKHKVPLEEQYRKAEPNLCSTRIDWIPSLGDYQQRVLRSLKSGIPAISLPSDFPQAVHVGAVWSGPNLNVEELITHLSEQDILEIEQALLHFKELGLTKNDISPETFPLPSLANSLERATHEVHFGRGVSIFRGLDPTRYAFEDNITIYAGITSYIGRIRGKQDNSGNILVHIKDVGSKVAPDNVRQSPYANNAQPFHNDLGDMIALYCMDRAETGGVSSLAPTATVYNELAAYRPDLIRELAAHAWTFDRHDGSQTYRSRPVLYHDSSNDRVFFCFSRRQLTGSTASPRPSYLPPLSEAQAEALDAVHFTAEKHALRIQLERGDIQVSNNLALFHAREAFKDGLDSNKRHLIRMWLRNERYAWPTPPELRDVWSEIYGNRRRPVWFMSPTHGRAHVINRTESCHG